MVPAFIACAAFGLFTFLAPAFLAGSLHHPSHALAGLAALVVFGRSAMAEVLLARRGDRDLLITGARGLVLGSVAILLAVWLATPSLTSGCS